jgi:hypothetical protein
MNDLQLFRQVMRHFVMGSSIGPIFAAALLALNSREVFDIVLNSSHDDPHHHGGWRFRLFRIWSCDSRVCVFRHG